MNIYQIKITLEHLKPAIWRRAQLAGDTSLSDLHDIIQVVMGWEDCHLHEFIIGANHYSVPGEDVPHGCKNERNAVLEKVARLGDKLTYKYDFGDGWRHTLKIEKLLTATKGESYPQCLAGERASPPEDCGGPYGYANLLDAISDPEHEEHEDFLDWIGDDFDPEVFDLAGINEALKRLR
jgi:hypothetical protein